MNGMIQKSKKNLKSKKGFTLIELIVVIVIIGILAAIIIPRLSGFTATAEEKACWAIQRTAETAVATQYAQTGGYPATLADIDPDLIGEEAVECPGTGALTYDNATGVVGCSVHTRE